MTYLQDDTDYARKAYFEHQDAANRARLAISLALIWYAWDQLPYMARAVLRGVAFWATALWLTFGSLGHEHEYSQKYWLFVAALYLVSLTEWCAILTAKKKHGVFPRSFF